MREPVMQNLTHQEKRIWYLEKLHQGTSMWNLPHTVKFKGIADRILLENAINLAIMKNDSLRIRITEADGEPYQYVSNYSRKDIDYIDLSGMDESESAEHIRQLSCRPFGLIGSELFYFAIVKFNEE